MHVHFMAQFLMERFTKSMKQCTPISLNIWNISRGSISTSRAGTSLRACSRVSGASSSSTTTTSSSPCSRSSQFRPRRGGQRTFYHFISPKSPSSCRYMCYVMSNSFFIDLRLAKFFVRKICLRGALCQAPPPNKMALLPNLNCAVCFVKEYIFYFLF